MPLAERTGFARGLLIFKLGWNYCGAAAAVTDELNCDF